MGKVLRSGVSGPRLYRGAVAGAVAFSVMIFAGSCNNNGCLENQNSLPLAGFYSYSSDSPLTLNSLNIGGVGAPNDSLLCKSGDAISQIYLPFRSTADVTSFYITYADSALVAHGVRDTMTFAYDSYPYLASEECGAMYRYRITSVSYTRNVVDSIAVTDSLITNIDAERIRIYFRTSDD
ncbi:MAG: hypothetical protein K2M29_00030 [Paramuribaculum sp.]|nr:hypothetical protein [Paramuribaculum sp.]